MPHADGYSRLKSSPKQDTHSSREIRWSLSRSQIFVKVLTHLLGFTTFLTSLRRSRYSDLSRKLSLSMSITENFHSRTCRSESWWAGCASAPTGPNMRRGISQPKESSYSFRQCHSVSSRAVQGEGLRPIASWDCWFESRLGHGCFCCTIRTKGKSRDSQWLTN